jgi:hypothetical protein
MKAGPLSLLLGFSITEVAIWGVVRRTWHKVTGLQALSGQMRYDWIFERYRGRMHAEMAYL